MHRRGTSQTPVGRSPSIIPVWFDPWRYERETDIIQPLLTSIFEAIEDRARGWALLREIGRSRKALASGFLKMLTFKASLGGVGLDVKPGELVKELEAAAEALPGSTTYLHAYQQLRSGLKRFARDHPADATPNGENKLVVFVDDLDRCLPESALAVLEAVKVFLGFKGIVYVLGLNDKIVQECVEVKYRPKDTVGEHPYGEELGRRYIEKIVQVPFRIPESNPSEMREFLHSMISDSPGSLGMLAERSVRSHVAVEERRAA
ncbi:MAG TPA: P-loop NTPase fold protein [Armatimonadota bacterium]|nr:P-loop NTPase fold protein [Armatimonadota bacterium]